MAKFTEAAIVSAITGRLITMPFSDVHGVIETMAGGPVWTHQLPEMVRRMKPAMERAFPDLAAIDVSGCTAETFEAWKAAHPELYVKTRAVAPLGDFAVGPFDGLDPERTVVVTA